jgi:hypothetical protein
MLTTSVMQHFDKELSAVAVLALFVAARVSSGGNSGLSGDVAHHARDGVARSDTGGLVAGCAARAADRAVCSA